MTDHNLTWVAKNIKEDFYIVTMCIVYMHIMLKEENECNKWYGMSIFLQILSQCDAEDWIKRNHEDMVKQKM